MIISVLYAHIVCAPRTQLVKHVLLAVWRHSNQRPSGGEEVVPTPKQLFRGQTLHYLRNGPRSTRLPRPRFYFILRRIRQGCPQRLHAFPTRQRQEDEGNYLFLKFQLQFRPFNRDYWLGIQYMLRGEFRFFVCPFCSTHLAQRLDQPVELRSLTYFVIVDTDIPLKIRS